jgi:Cd2+/Zn2+-exporting ATPase
MAAGITRGGRRGILIKGGAHLEHLAAIKVVAFDKTGTLTEGRPRVTDAIPVDTDLETLLAIAAGLERFSEHPLAQAIVARADELNITPLEATESKALMGAGTQATVKGAVWYVGSPTLFRTRGHELAAQARQIESLEGEGKTTVLVGTDRVVAGIIALQDTIRPNASKLVRDLKEAGIHVAMLTGDNPRTASAVAALVGITDVKASLKPADKQRAIAEYAEKTPRGVLMVGDGVNDAPALASASCGMAMGAVGSDAAIEAADVALMSDDLEKVSEALLLARQVRSVSRQNVAFSIAVLAVLIPAALFDVLGVAAAVIAHEGSELLAVANGLRAGRLQR